MGTYQKMTIKSYRLLILFSRYIYISITNKVDDNQFSEIGYILLLPVCSHQNDLTAVLVIDSKSRQSGHKIEVH